MNSPRLCFLAALLVALPVQADVMYQCIDESGHKSFSNVKSTTKGTRCTAMDLGPVSSVPPPPKPAAKAATPAGPAVARPPGLDHRCGHPSRGTGVPPPAR